MKRLLSWTGVVFAALYALAFLALYVWYLLREGTWFADLPLALAALPFTLLMRALNGGAYAFAGDMSGRVVAAGAFGSALAYVTGMIVESAVRALARFLLAARWSAD
jgi:hypothetical protein